MNDDQHANLTKAPSTEQKTTEQVALETAALDKAESRIRRIRQKAFRELEGTLKAKRFRANILHRELLTLKPKGQPTYFLEAIIATAVAGKIKAPKAHSRLMQLKKRQLNAGLTDEYEAFEALLLNFLGGSMFTQHGYDLPSFRDLDHDDVWKNVSDVFHNLDALGYKAFLNSGTLLGVVRDQSLIEHDDDVDLAVVLKSTNTKDAATEWADLHMKLLGLSQDSTSQLSTPLPIEVHPETGCKIDLFPCWIEEGQVYLYPHTSGELSEADILPLKKCQISGLPLPAEPNKMLEVNYGKNWMIPDPGFQFGWWGAYKKFTTLRTELGITK